MRISTLLGGLASLSLLGACQGEAVPLAAVPHVDLERFMGDWYVIACIPTSLLSDTFRG